MARYIDADELIKKIFPYDVVDKKEYAINAYAVYDAIQKTPSADVVSKSEVEKLIELHKEQRKRSMYWARKVTAEQIFEDLELRVEEHDGCSVNLSRYEFAELKKKYTENSQS